jgi:hypothetical protein
VGTRSLVRERPFLDKEKGVMRGTRRGFSMMRGVQADTPLMRSLLRCGRVHIVLGLICWTDGEIASSMLLARPYLLVGIVMVAETLGPICLMCRLLVLVSPSFVSCDLRPFDCSILLVLMGTV